jgi:AcrR family transcriptional regulator
MTQRTSSSPPVSLRSALIDAAARLIATEGAPALTLRRVADEVGTSTMAIYTHFGGMPELRRAVRREGFARLAAQLADVGGTADPVADLGMLGRAYYENAIGDPHLYRVTFMEQSLDADDAAVGTEAFKSLAAGVERCIVAGRFDAGNASQLAMEFWAIGHGVITLQLAQLLQPEEALRCLNGALLKLFRAYGDEPDAADRSLRRARRRRAPGRHQAVA